MSQSTASSPGFAKMEGTLWKWTNYLSGWQPRWFVLEHGILAYFLSPNEVTQGSRGSLKVGSCDVAVHATDHQRMDIVMPGGRHIYLRAASTAERQKWLIGIGYAKQGGLSLEPKDSEKIQADAVKKKMAALHLHCQLLVSQIGKIRTASSAQSPSPDELSDLSKLVSTTCDAFLNTLSECMDLSLAESGGTSPTTLKPLAVLPGELSLKGGTRDGISPSRKTPTNGFSEEELYRSSPPKPHRKAETMSLPAHLIGGGGAVKQKKIKEPVLSSDVGAVVSDNTTGTQHSKPSQVGPSSASVEAHSVQFDVEDSPPLSFVASSDSSRTHSRNNSELFLTPTTSPQASPPSTPLPKPSTAPPVTKATPPTAATVSRRVGDRVTLVGRPYNLQTFFSRVPNKFEDLVLTEGDLHIPTIQFLSCCRDVVPFFDTLSGTAFAPVKADINGNIEKLSRKYEEHPELYPTLQAIVLHELKTGTHGARNSATDALLWLKRAMEFVQVFLAEVCAGEHALDVAAGKAYSKSLRRFHNWIVKGVFSLAMKAVPYHKDFLLALGSDGTMQGDRTVVADMDRFATALGSLVTILNHFYQAHDLDSPPTNSSSSTSSYQ